MEKRIIARVPQEYERGLEKLVTLEVIKNKSAGIRAALHEYLTGYGIVVPE